MDDIFGSIIPVIIIISALVRFINKNFGDEDNEGTLGDRIKKFLNGVKEIEGSRSDPDKAGNKLDHQDDLAVDFDNDEEWIPAYEEKEELERKKPLEKTDLTTRYQQKKNNLDDEINVRDGKTVKRDSKLSVNNNSSQRLATIEKKKEDTGHRISKDSFKGKELIRGIIFKEILDAPRARRPYRSHYWKE